MKSIPDVIKARTKQQVVQTSDTVKALPPGYMKGFTLSAPENVLTVSPGIANIKGSRTILSQDYVIDGNDYTAPAQILPGLFYNVYVNTRLDFLVDTVKPKVDDQYFAYYHPAADTYRYIGQFYLGEGLVYQNIISYNPMEFNSVTTGVVDSLLLSVETFLKVGYKGTGTYQNPHEGDTFLYIDGDEIQVVEYTGGAWVSKLKIGGDGGGTNQIFRPLFSGIGLDHIDSPTDDLENFPATGFFVNTFNNVYTDQYGTNDWTYTNTAFVTTWSKYTWSHSLACNDGFADNVNTTTQGTVGDSFSLSSWVNLVRLPSSNPSGPYLLFVDGLGTGFLINYDVDNNDFVVNWFDGVVDEYLEINASKVGGLLGEHYIGITFNADTGILYFFVDDVYVSADLGLSFWTGGGAWRNVIFPSLNANVLTGYTTIMYSETVYSYIDFVKPEVFIEHYNHNIPWETERSRADQVIYCAPGGRIQFIDHMPEESSGTLHMLTIENRPTGWVLSAGTSATWADVDFSAYVPLGVRSLLLTGYFNASATNHSYIYFRPKGSTVDNYYQNVVEEVYYSGIGGGQMVMHRQFMVGCDRNGYIQYRRVYGSVYLGLVGYWI